MARGMSPERKMYNDTPAEEEYEEYLDQQCALVGFGISWVTLAFAALGVVSNFISVIIYSRPCMRSSINILLTGLSAIDTLVCLLSIPTFVVPSMCVYWPESILLRIMTTYGTLYLYPLANMCQTSSTWVFVVITFERWIAVCRPFRARWSTTSRSIKALLIVCISSIVYNMIRFFEHSLADHQFISSPNVSRNASSGDYVDDSFNGPTCNQIQQRLRTNYYYMSVYYSGLYLITHFAFPFSILALVNAKMTYSIHRARRERLHLSNTERKEHRTTIMMAAIVLMFLCSNTLPFVLNFMEQVDENVFRKSETKILMFTLNDISNLLVLVNASTTCFIYYGCSQKYRRLAHLYVVKCGRGENDHVSSRQLSVSSINSVRRGFTILATTPQHSQSSINRRTRSSAPLRRYDSCRNALEMNILGAKSHERIPLNERYVYSRQWSK